MGNAKFAALSVTLCLAASSAGAQQFKNVTDFDPGFLLGKTCRGTFTTGGSCEKCMGAFRFTFVPKEGAIYVHYWSEFGQKAFAGAFTKDLELTTDGGESPMQIDHDDIEFTSPQRAKFELAYDKASSGLGGTVDPRKMAGRENWRPAKVKLSCAME